MINDIEIDIENQEIPIINQKLPTINQEIPTINQQYLEIRRKNNLNETISYNQGLRMCLDLIISIIHVTLYLYYAINDDSCVNIHIDKYFITLRQFFITYASFLLLKILIIIFNNKVSAINNILDLLFPFGMFAALNVYQKCSQSLYTFIYIEFFLWIFSINYIIRKLVKKVYMLEKTEV